MDEAGEIFNNVSIGVYDVVASTAPAREGFQKAQFAETIIMREAGVMIPDEHVIRLSNLEDRHRIAEQVANLQGTAPPGEEEQQMSQMQMQLQMAEAQGRVEELSAKSQLLQAQAMLAMTKAQTEEGAEKLKGAEMSVKYNTDLAKVQKDLIVAREQFANKIEIAKIHTAAKRSGEMMGNATKSFGAQLTYKAQVEKIMADRLKLAAPTSSES